MEYISTRGQAPKLSFEGVLLSGLARDGGLYVPNQWPTLTAGDIESLRGQSYQQVAFSVIQPFVTGEIDDASLKQMIDTAYASFSHEAVTPLSQLAANDWLLELYHGPTLAFKDVAMQLLGQLFDDVLRRRQERITIIGATSGDTGSSAIEAMRGRDAVDIFILHPHNRTSEVQRRQMTTVLDENVHNIAIKGTFDDCQALVKAMFNDSAFRDQVAMGGVNSINWARVMAQVVYYFYAAIALGAPDRKVSFTVPTGNFGDVLAGYVAGQMGLPIEDLVIATNVNDILTRTLATGEYRVTSVTPTSSPSMDIQVSSNFERLLFDAYGRQPGAVVSSMHQLSDQGVFQIEPAAAAFIAKYFKAARVDESQTAETIKSIYERTGRVVDPHTAVGLAAAVSQRGPVEVPMVSLATAHPAKFPEAVGKAIGLQSELPDRLSDLFSRPEQFDVLDNDLETVKAHISARTRV